MHINSKCGRIMEFHSIVHCEKEQYSLINVNEATLNMSNEYQPYRQPSLEVTKKRSLRGHGIQSCFFGPNFLRPPKQQWYNPFYISSTLCSFYLLYQPNSNAHRVFMIRSVRMPVLGKSHSCGIHPLWPASKQFIQLLK